MTTASGDAIGAVRNVLYRKMPVEFDANLLREIAVEILALPEIAAATIAKGRIGRLEAALQKIADDDYDPVGPHDSFTEAAADIARAARDSGSNSPSGSGGQTGGR